MIRVAFVVAHDAFFKSACNIRSQISLPVTEQWFSTSHMLCQTTEEYPLVKIDIDGVADQIEFSELDYLFVGLGGKDLNRLIHGLNKRALVERPKIIGFFPGVLHFRIYEALLSRLLCDAVLLNCSRDYELYRELAYISLGYNNGVLYGAPWVTAEPDLQNATNKDIDLLFVEQSIVPVSLSERTALVASLHRLALTNPLHRFVVKLRTKKIEATSHQLKYCLEEIYQQQFTDLENLIFCLNDIDALVDRAKRICTVSSSVAITSLLKGKDTLFISDFGIRKDYGNDLFANSGCFTALECYQERLNLHPAWSERYLKLPDAIVLISLLDKLMHSSQKLFLAIPDSWGVRLKIVISFIRFKLVNPGASFSELKAALKTVRNINSKIYKSGISLTDKE
jgi:hypothetical protein